MWDVKTGERLAVDPSLRPLAYHPASREFLSAAGDGSFLVSRRQLAG